MFFRFILVNVFSFIKRFFAFNAGIYNTIVFIPLLTVLTPRISKNSILFVLIISIILFFTGNINSYGNFIMYFLLLLAIPMFKRANFDELVNKSIPFFIVVCLYGISQKIFGYSPVEINWIQSGLSFADEREFIGGGDVRPFSTFASMPEFTLFIAIFLYYFTIEKKRWYIIFAVIMLYIAGSRGVFISTLIAYFFTFFVKRYSSWYLFLAFLASLTIFLCLVFVFPIIFNSQEETTRMLAYGTFNGRVELLNRVLETSSASYLFTGVDIKSMGLEPTFDNFYFMLTAHFGVFGGLYFLFFFLRPKVNKKNYYFFAIFLGYGFYADMVFSYYLMFLFFFAIYSYSDSLISTKSQLQTSLTPANNHLSNNIC